MQHTCCTTFKFTLVLNIHGHWTIGRPQLIMNTQNRYNKIIISEHGISGNVLDMLTEDRLKDIGIR